jgi:signal transduction histidine kinase
MEMVPLKISEVMKSVFNLLQNDISMIKPDLHIDFSQVSTLKFNRPYLESILSNLFTNSLKYRSLERPLQINIYTEPASNGGVILHFSDNGLGFDLSRMKDRMFGLYQRFHKHPDSKGMGLYLVKSQLEALGGKIEVESSVDCGAHFILKFK